MLANNTELFPKAAVIAGKKPTDAQKKVVSLLQKMAVQNGQKESELTYSML